MLDQVLENHDKMEQMRNELRGKVQSFLDSVEPDTDMKVPEEIEEKLKLQARRLAIMRAQGDFDRYSNELMKDVAVEIPSRLVHQLKTLYICLISLSPDYPSEKALAVIDKVVESSGEPRREEIFQELIDRKEVTSYQLSKTMRVSRKMIERDLQVLWNLELVEKKRKERDGEQSDVTLWSVNESNDLIKLLSNGSVHQDIERVLENNEKEGVSYQTVFEEVSAPEEKIETVLEQMLEAGEILESKPGKIKKI